MKTAIMTFAMYFNTITKTIADNQNIGELSILGTRHYIKIHC